MTDPLFIIVDLFCGAGGTTTGFVQAELEGNGIAKVIACVNHDPKAIKSHWSNHPEVKHFEEDIRTLDLTDLVALTNFYRIKYPDAYVILWASLECTNFSKAKGGQPRDADSRTLADHLDRYVIALQPDYVQIENVVEFMSWGPLDENGKPVSRKNGQDFMRWRKIICNHGYTDDWRQLNSADYGAYTSRNRLFGIFARPGLPIVWPEPTHTKKPTVHSIHGDLQKWKAVKEVLNFDDEGESIFTRSKPLSDKTLERIYAGLLKYVANGDTSFIQKHFSGKPMGKVIPVNGPAGVITTSANQSLVSAQFLLKYNSTNKETGKHIPPSVDEPSPVVSCQSRLGIVQTEFLTIYNGKSLCRSVNEPAPVIACNDRFSLIQPEYFQFLSHYYSNGGGHSSIENPAPTIPTKARTALVECQSFIMPTNYDNTTKSIDDPAPVITANRKHHYLVNPSHGGRSTSTDQPCPVIVARQDKVPLYLVQTESGPVAVPIYEGDSPVMIKIKQFMAVFGIVDIKMRMLRVPELLAIQGFPTSYRLEGNQADQKKFIGNSVVPLVVQRWIEALGSRLIETYQQRIA